LNLAALVPAYQAAPTVLSVVEAIRSAATQNGVAMPVLVIDDGSTDATADVAQRAGAEVVRHTANLGKGAALMTGLRLLETRGFDAAVTIDADGQHPAEEALRLAQLPFEPNSLVLGVRDLVAAGAPQNSRFSNRVSNYFLSRFAGMQLLDTQCGLRRYPVAETLRLGLRSPGYAFEAEVILRAVRARWSIQQVPVRVIYPPEAERISHFHVVRDPTRIVCRVLRTWLDGVFE
jgi:glycosyltransferase involved in cell wall biosynthesis